MLAIQDWKDSLSAQISSIRMDISLLKLNVHNLRDRTGFTEECISSLEEAVYPLSTTVREHTNEMVAILFLLSLMNWRTAHTGTTPVLRGSWNAQRAPIMRISYTPGCGISLVLMHLLSPMLSNVHTVPLHIPPQLESLHASLWRGS